MIQINLASEYVMSVFGLRITNTFLTSVLVTGAILLFVLLRLLFQGRYSQNEGRLSKMARVFIVELRDIVDSVTGDRQLTYRILPLVGTFFVFIFCANMLGVIPGFLGAFFVHTPSGDLPLFRSPNSDLTITLALAIISVISAQYFSLRALGIRGYLRRFFSFASPVQFIRGFFELISEAVKVLSFSFRLFGNLFAGEVLLLIIGFLIPYLVPVPFMALEVFVGVIQAFIFAMLTLTFVKVDVTPS